MMMGMKNSESSESSVESLPGLPGLPGRMWKTARAGRQSTGIGSLTKVSEKFKLQTIMTGKWGSCGTPWEDLTSELRTWNKEKI